ncbi:NACHT domain-containing protein [Streptomyces sp. NPDC096339]|uniref:NACHT domain-containing protein n=1 Tax=Streptomyces sp. NPDC096339 TaxID=3366086 RepID=UPI0037F59D28
MAGAGGNRPKGPQRPDPAAAAPDRQPWAALMRRVYDELWMAPAPADRLSVRAMAREAHISSGAVSQFFSGKTIPELDCFLPLVTALGGDPGDWEPRWHRAAARAKEAEDGDPDPGPLPGVADESPEEEAAQPLSGPGTELPRYPVRRFLRAVLAGVAAVFTFLGRLRRDKAAAKMQRRVIKGFMEKAAEDFRRSEAHYYLEPRFVILEEGKQEPAPRTGRRAGSVPRAAPERVETDVSNIRALYGARDDLVVLGKPGMGKTTQLALLAHRLAEEALAGGGGADPAHIPVYLRLYGYRGEAVEDWLTTEMSRIEGVSAVLVRSWLEQHLLLPVLDGLDEVPKVHWRKCVKELRRLRELCPGMAVGCRTDEGDLKRLAESLRGLSYVEIQPPEREEVEAFLNANRTALADVRAALTERQDLWPLLQSPMMLNIICVAYANRSADDLRLGGTLDDRQSRIFDAYVGTCLRSDRPQPDDAPHRTLTWLTWLARTLTERKEQVLYLDRLDLSWLSRREAILPKIVPTVAMAACALGVPVLWLVAADRAGVLHADVPAAAVVALGMVANTAVQAYQSEEHFLTRPEPGRGGETKRGRGREKERGALVIPMVNNRPAMLVILTLMLLTGVHLGSPGAIVVGLAYLWVATTQMEGMLTDVFSPVEQLRWTWRRSERAMSPQGFFPVKRLALSIAMWISIDLLVGYVVHLVCPEPDWIAPVVALALGTFYVFGNQFEPSLQDRRPRPNEGIRRTVRFSLVHGFAGLAVAAVFVTTLIGLASPDQDLRRAGFVAGLLGTLFAVVRGFRYGGLAVVRHWTIRAVLAHRGSTPYRYGRFLHTAEQRVLLFRTDSGFFFPHSLVQRHFVTTAEELLPRVGPLP